MTNCKKGKEDVCAVELGFREKNSEETAGGGEGEVPGGNNIQASSLAAAEEGSEDGEGNGKGQPDPDQVHMDGWRAWLVCLGGFLSQVIVVGFLHAYGVFFVTFLEEFGESKAKTAWVASLAYGLAMGLGPPVSYLINRVGHRAVSITGAVICASSMLASSFAQSLNVLFASFAMLYGVGMSLNYTPTMCIADEFFNKRLTLATGIMTAGSSTGTLVMSVTSQALVDRFGWAVAFRVLAGLVFLSAGCGLTFIPLPGNRRKQEPSPDVKRLMAKGKLWKNKLYLIWLAGITCAMFGYFIPYVHLVSHARQTLGFTAGQGSALMMALGAATAAGRVTFGQLISLSHSTTARVYYIQIAMVITGIASIILPILTSFGALLCYVITLGLVDGCIVVLLPVLTCILAGRQHKVVAWGFTSFFASVTFTSGPPIAGWLSDMTGSYTLAFRIAGIPIIAGAIILGMIPCCFDPDKPGRIPETVGWAGCTTILESPSPTITSMASKRRPTVASLFSIKASSKEISKDPEKSSTCHLNGKVNFQVTSSENTLPRKTLRKDPVTASCPGFNVLPDGQAKDTDRSSPPLENSARSHIARTKQVVFTLFDEPIASSSNTTEEDNTDHTTDNDPNELIN